MLIGRSVAAAITHSCKQQLLDFVFLAVNVHRPSLNHYAKNDLEIVQSGVHNGHRVRFGGLYIRPSRWRGHVQLQLHSSRLQRRHCHITVPRGGFRTACSWNRLRSGGPTMQQVPLVVRHCTYSVSVRIAAAILTEMGVKNLGFQWILDFEFMRNRQLSNLINFGSLHTTLL